MKLTRIALICLLAGPALSVDAAGPTRLQLWVARQERLKRVFRKSMPPDVVTACVDKWTPFVLTSRGLEVSCGNRYVQGALLDDLRQEGFAVIKEPGKSQDPMEMGAYQLIDSALFQAAADIEPEIRVSMSKIRWPELQRVLFSLKEDIAAGRRRAEASAEAERIGGALEHSGAVSVSPQK